MFFKITATPCPFGSKKILIRSLQRGTVYPVAKKAAKLQAIKSIGTKIVALRYVKYDKSNGYNSSH